MLDTRELAEIRQSIHSVDTRLSADIAEIRKELSALRSAQWQAEGRAQHNAFVSDMRNNTRWVLAALVMWVVTIIFAIIVAL